MFWASFFIIVREGFEILLLTMLIYTAVDNNKDVVHVIGNRTYTDQTIRRTKRYMGFGISCAVALSFVLASIFNSHADAEAYETVVFLLASAMLFYIAIWCHNATKYLHKFNNVISKGSSIALAFAVFLIFAREGFETVMFYAALFSHKGADIVLAYEGGALGIVSLFVLYRIMKYSRSKLSVPTLFTAASVITFLFAVYFGAKGLHEFAEVNQIWWLHDPLDFLHEGDELPIH
jgi:high-affinity iron transporter